ncbi:protein kinase activating protein dpb11 [Coemansia sp. RSA 552]|nr:protein kinase activating protein dpb11 [Coemansia sp. RSA 552]
MAPLFPLLRGLCLSCSGLNPQEKDSAYQRIEKLGGSVSLQLTNLVTHVIMKGSLPSSKYRVSAKLGIPVVSLAFLDECEEEARRRSSSEGKEPLLTDPTSTDNPAAMAVRQIVGQTWYRPFSGCCICTTGFDFELREEINRLVTSGVRRDHSSSFRVLGRAAGRAHFGDTDAVFNVLGGGGSYHCNLTLDCSHLIALKPAGQKYEFARKWNLHVVTLEWLLDTMRTGYCQDETRYVLAEAETHPPPAQNPRRRTISRKTSAASTTPRASAAAVAIPPTRSASATAGTLDGRVARLPLPGELDFTNAEGEPDTSDGLGMAHIDCLEPTRSDSAYSARRQSTSARLSPASGYLAGPCDALKACRIALSEAWQSANDLTIWQERISAMGGVWVPGSTANRQAEARVLHDAQERLCTHYIVDSSESISGADETALRTFVNALSEPATSLADRPWVVGIAWLDACWRSKVRVNELEYSVPWDEATSAGSVKPGASKPADTKQGEHASSPWTRAQAQKPAAVDMGKFGQLPPQPKYSRTTHTLADAAMVGNSDGMQSLRSLVGKPLRSSSIADAEPNPFMAGTPRKRGFFGSEGSSAGEEIWQGPGRHKHRREAHELQAAGCPSSSPKLELTVSSETEAEGDVQGDSALEHADVHPNDDGLFSRCLFTSLGFSSHARSVLERVACENGGAYTGLACSALGNADESHVLESDAQLRRALAKLAQSIDGKSVVDVYIVVQIGGVAGALLCEDAASVTQHMHLVTDCWVEQCLHEGIRYPDYDTAEAAGKLLPAMSKGQHVLFRPLRPGIQLDVHAVSLSISGYEAMEREHIGKLALALGIPFSEKFSRRTTHLLCRPPFKGPKYERAVKWGVPVTDSGWIYGLAAAGPMARPYALPGQATRKQASASSVEADPQPEAQGCGAKLLPSPSQLPHRRPPDTSVECKAYSPETPRPPNAAGAAMTTPTARSTQQLLAGTPGRTPIDVSLERNLSRAMSNNRKRPAGHWLETAAHTATNASGEDDATQMSFSGASSAPAPAAACPTEEDTGSTHVFEGVVVALSARLHHRRAELTALALRLGCRVLGTFDVRQATHLIHQSQRERETQRDYRVARRHNIAVVSPWWLHACGDAQVRLPEAEYPHTFQPERRLKLVPQPPSTHPMLPATEGSQSTARQSTALQFDNKPAGPTSPTVPPGPPALAAPSAALARRNEHTAQMDSRTIPGPVSTAYAGTVDGLLGERGSRARRRYRTAAETPTPKATAESTQARPAAQRDKTRRPDPPIYSSPVSSPHRQSAPQPCSKWWLNQETGLYSQEPAAGGSIGMGSMPDTVAVEDALQADMVPASPLAHGTEKPPSRHRQNQSSRQGAMVVYGEDVDALSERDRLIQRLVGK